jgi:aspartyl protease family protein
MTKPRLRRTAGGAFLHTLVWLLLIGTIFGVIHFYTEGALNPNRVPEVTGSGEVVLKRDRAGHFSAGGAINGQPVRFLIDTGATQIAVSTQLAERLSLKRGLPIQLMTAAGPARGYMTRLQSVTLASFELRDAAAIIADGLDPNTVLLGMNFLRQLEIVQRGDQLILRPAPQKRSSAAETR